MTRRLAEGITLPNTTFWLHADEFSTNPGGNSSVVRAYLEAVNNGSTGANYTWHDASVVGYINGTPVTVSGNSADLPSGTPNGGNPWFYGPWDITVPHDADGSKTASLQLSVSYPHATSDTGGTVYGSLPLTTLKVAPGAPSGVSASRLSDSLMQLVWTNTGASNGQATQNVIEASVNGAAFSTAATIAAAGTVTLPCAANQKVLLRVAGKNTAGTSAFTTAPSAIFTTPAEPTSVAAAKVAGGDIKVTWTPQVAFAEHEHVIEESTDGGGSWSPLDVVASGTSTYTHTAPSTLVPHKYRVKARNLDTGALVSAWVESGTVVLLTAPNKPTLPTLGPNVDKGKAFDFPWTHNPVDTTGQTAYEVGYSTNGGTTWSSTGKVTSTTPQKTFAANTYAADTALTLRVRTWGQATTGGSEGTGASPWSDQVTVTFKTRPVASITSPANAGTYTQAALDVHLGFSQAEAALFVSATIELFQGAVLLESRVSTTLASTVLATRVADGSSYTVKVVVRDSNGLVSDQVAATFSVDYTEPVPAGVVVTYLDESGIGQIGVTIAAPGAGQAAAVAVTITRTIGEDTETLVEGYPASASLTFLDMTPTIVGDNVYTVTTISGDGATVSVIETMTTDEDEWAFLSGGDDFAQIVKFGGDFKPTATPTVDAVLVKTSGRSRPIGLYATTGGLVVSGTGEVVTGLGSSPQELEEFLLIPGRKCYRDPTGRRMFGMVTGSVSRDSYNLGSFPYTVTETS